MKKMFLLAVCVTAFLVASCEGGEAVDVAEGASTVFVEPLIGSEQVVGLSEVASKVEYIPLETSQESIVGDLRHARIENNVIYLPDHRINKLSRFSLDGKYLGDVGRYGRAYGEFVSIGGFSFDFDYDTGAELVFDRDKKLIEYHKDGSVKEIRLERMDDKVFSVDFIKKHGNIYVCAISRFDTQIGNLVFLDSSGKLMGRFPTGYESSEYKEPNVRSAEQGLAVFSVMLKSSFRHPYRFGNKLMVTNPTNDTIFAFMPDDTIAHSRYIIDYGKYSDMTDEYGEDFIKFVATFTQETSNHLFLSFNFGKERSPENKEVLTRVLFDKSTGEARSLLGRLENDIDGGPSFWPLHVSREGQMIAIIQAIDFIDAAKESNSAKMKEVAAGLTDESNPVIMLVTE